MDFSEKDAARSKWKLTQRHRRGRGRGGPTPRGRQHTSGARDLGSNQDRYEEPEVDEHAGPVCKSLGADLAELLERADAYDAGYYFRSKANLLEEYGLPPGDALAYQGLSFDLKGLAACLSLLPRNQLLATDAFDEDEDEQEQVGQAEQRQPARQAAVQQEQRQQQAAVTPAAPPIAQAAAAVARGSLDGHKPYTPSMGVSTGTHSLAPPATGTTTSSSAAAAAVPARPTAPAAAAPKPAAAAPAQQRLAPTPSQPQPQPAQQAAGQEDAELDFLLGLMDIQGPGGAAPVAQPQAGQWPPLVAQPQPAAAVRPLPQQQQQQQQQGTAVTGAAGGISRIAPAPQQQPKEQSLDEWLDSL